MSKMLTIVRAKRICSVARLFILRDPNQINVKHECDNISFPSVHVTVYFFIKVELVVLYLYFCDVLTFISVIHIR